jgi:serine/threonine protein kinase
MAWPNVSAYQDAVQNPHLTFKDPELRTGQPEPDPRWGNPRARTGNFACVFKIHSGQTDWAVKCFTQEVKDLQERYDKIGQYLSQINLPYMLDFHYLPEGIRVDRQWYPILKMQWVHGELLNQYIEHHLSNSAEMQQLAARWIKMMNTLHANSIAHGDLQEHNVLVVNGQLKLVDYDGMFVPALSGRLSNEIGHENYQHPQRSEKDFGPALDNFAAWVIYVSLTALSIDPSLWARTKAGDDCLLFRKADFAKPLSSPTFGLLTAHRDPSIQALATLFRSTLYFSPLQVPSLDGHLSPPTPTNTNPSSSQTGWWLDHGHFDGKPDYAPESLQEQSSSPAMSWVLDFVLPPKGTVARGFNQSLTLPRLTWIFSGLIFASAVGMGAFLPDLFPSLFEVNLSYFLSFAYILLTLSATLISLNTVVFAWCYHHEPAVGEKKALLAREKSTRAPMLELEKTVAEYQNEQIVAKHEETRRRKELNEALKRLQERERKDLNEALVAHDRNIASTEARLKSIDQEYKDVLAKLNATLGSNLNSLNSQISSLATAESYEQVKTLAGIQKRYVDDYLQQHSIHEGLIGMKGYASRSSLQSALHAHGIRTARDISYGRVDAVPGFGPKRTQILVNWANDLVHEATKVMPSDLSPNEKNAIKAKYESQRKSLESQRDAEQSRFSAEQKAVRDRHELARQSLQNELSVARTQASQRTQEINDRFAKQYEAPTQALAKLHSEFSLKYQEIDHKTNLVRQNMFGASWQIAKIEHEKLAYRNISFAKYVGRVFLGNLLT